MLVDRYISEKALIDNIVKIVDLRTLSTKTIGEALKNTPTADVAEVTRCKDCKHSWADFENIYYCKNDKGIEGVLRKDDFCSYGERRTDNDL